MERVRTTRAIEWLRVEDGPPPYDHDVLVTDGDEVCQAARSHTDQEGEHWTCPDGSDFDRATHWAELPTPPAGAPKA